MKNTREEQLVNRIMINFAIAAAAYIGVYMLINKFYLKWSVVLPLALVMLVAAVLCYIFNKNTGKTKNYGHMFLAFFIALISTQASFLIWKIFGVEFFASIYNNNIIKELLNSRKAAIGMSWLGAVYLVGMTIYNIVAISKEKKNNKKSRKNR